MPKQDHPQKAGDRSVNYLLVGLMVLALFPAYAEHATSVEGAYAVESQVVLPHMEEMRRIYKSAQVCISNRAVHKLFPILEQPGLKACFLLPLNRHQAISKYKLRCPGVNGASGSAQLEFSAGEIKGELQAKMGGKNMTFVQYVNARRQGECEK